MTKVPVLDAAAVEAIATLCQRALARPPAADELAGALFADDQAVIVRGDPAVGVVAAVPDLAGGGAVRLLVVDPAHQGQGHGRRLLEAAEDDLRSGRPEERVTVTIGADPPYYLFPGVESTQTAMLCLLESCRYERAEANFNMDLTLGPEYDGPAPPGPVLATAQDRAEVDAFVSEQWANWRAEALRALDHGSLLVDRDERGLTGFCAWDVNRRGLIGPVAVRMDLIGRGRGGPLLVGALHHLRAGGRTEVEVSWVGPIRPYARVGATVGRVFFVYRKTFA